MNRAVAVACVILMLLGLPIPASPSPAASPSPEQNLLGAIKLWGDVKFFDPQLTYGAVDWDVALANAEPALLAASTKDSYVAAVESMLAQLNDPATHVDRDDVSQTGRITSKIDGDAALITVPRDVTADESLLASDADKALQTAANAGTVAFDLRGVNESTDGGATALDHIFADSSFSALVQGKLTMPRVRSRAYLGYVDESGIGYQNYSSQDAVSDPGTITGTSNAKHRFVFLVDGNSSVPSAALALAQAGEAAIYSTGGTPSTQAASADDITLPYGVSVTYRTSELADIAQPLQLPAAASLQDAIAKKQSPPAQFEHPLTRPLKANSYADATFPSEGMRMLAIAKIYNVIRYFSPYTALMHDDWDAAALQAIKDERAATDARSYVLGLMRFYSHLHDSHGALSGKIVQTEFGAGVPFSARYLHDRVVVDRLFAPPGSMQGLRVGDVVDAVDGVPVRQAMNTVEQFVASSTPQAADYAALRSSRQPSIFSGRRTTPVKIAFHHGTAQEQAATFYRDTFTVKPDRTGPKYFVLPGNVGYVDFDRIDPSEVGAMFDALKRTRAIVFDNRGYPQGAAWAAAPRLTAAAQTRAALFDTPLVTGPIDDTQGDAQMLPVFREFYQLLPVSQDWKYLKPTVMLVDERSISQAEHSALFFREANHTAFVGMPTQGANGDVTGMTVPGGVTLYFSGEGVRHVSGDRLQRLGIVPDVRAEPTASDIARNNDVVLQAGLSEALRLTSVSETARRIALREEVQRERTVSSAPPVNVALTAAGSNEQPLELQWTSSSTGYTGSAAASTGYKGADEISLQCSGDDAASSSFGSFAGALSLDAYRGKTIRIRGYLKAEGVVGSAGFWLRVDGPSRQFDNMHDRWLSGTTEWERFAIVLHVPANATKAFAGLLLLGRGTARASALTIDTVPNTTPTTDD